MKKNTRWMLHVKQHVRACELQILPFSFDNVEDFPVPLYL